MCLLLSLCLLLILTACSVPPQEPPVPTEVSPATEATTPQAAIPGAALTSVPTMAQTRAATTAPTMTPTSPPLAAPTFLRPLRLHPPYTRPNVNALRYAAKCLVATTPAAGNWPLKSQS
jgi:hypothetical protein